MEPTNHKIHNLNLFLYPVVEDEEVAFTIPWNLSFGWSNLLSADKLFVDDVLLPLHLLHHHKVMDGSSTNGDRSNNNVGGFFYATPLLWLGSVWYYILFNNCVDILFVVAGSLSFTKQLIGSYNSFSLETLFLLTPPSLFSIPQPLRLQWLKNGSNGIFEHSQLVEGTWPWAYEAFGYFAYDQGYMLHYHLYSGWIPSILVHHVVLLCFTLARYRNITINYVPPSHPMSQLFQSSSLYFCPI